MKKNAQDSLSSDPDAPQPLTPEEQEYLSKAEAGTLEELPAEEEEKKAKDQKYSYYHSLHYNVDPDAGLIYRNYDMISRQRRLALTLIKQIGINVLRGKSIMNISLPVNVFEPASLLDRVASQYAYVPNLLSPIVAAKDPVEKMRLLMCWAVASMHLGIGQCKPFNPILGETLQGRIGDMQIYCEQVEHHPPIARILLVGKNLRIYAINRISVHTYPNTAKARPHGKRWVEVGGANPAVYSLTYPMTEITGIMFGKRIFKYVGDTFFHDKTNGLYGLVRVNPHKQGFIASLFTKKTYREDHIRGLITKNKALLTNPLETVFNSKEVLSQCEGSWIDDLSFDGTEYWEIGKHPPLAVVRSQSPLTSDCSNRADLQALQRGDEKESQQAKEQMEDAQRKDRKLREIAAKERAEKEKSKLQKAGGEALDETEEVKAENN